jgi:hypothetical protein
MDKLTSILVVTNRSVADGTLLAKAVLLARRVGARIHLFHCDALDPLEAYASGQAFQLCQTFGSHVPLNVPQP